MAEPDRERRSRVETLVRALCSPACAGRAPGTPEGIAARELVVQAMIAAGVAPGGSDGYLQVVPRCGANVLGELPGSGSLAERTIVIGAHYDHLGKVGGGQAFWGADDNAAAVAILVETGRALRAMAAGLVDGAAGRRVILAAYDGEEPPHFMQGTMGSMYHVAHLGAPLASIDMMVCMDLCGHALGPEGLPREVRDSLLVLGAELSAGTAALVERAARPGGVVPRRADLDLVPPLSDYYPFRAAGVPVLFLTCGRWQHYHQITDTPDRLDYAKIVATVDYLVALVQLLRTRPEAPVQLQTHARDDAGTIASLMAVTTLLGPYSPVAARAMTQLSALASLAASGPLAPARRGELARMVQVLEGALA